MEAIRNHGVGSLTRRLAGDDRQLVIVAGFAAFMTYLCMYAARRPYSVLSYEGMDFLGISLNDNVLTLKVMLGIAQVIGYFISKVIGTKVCSEAGWDRRFTLLNLLLLASIGALALFWVLPGPWKVLAMFLNGLPLGMVWGLVVGYLEGRRRSEMLLAILSISFIVGSGIVKDVGAWLVAAPPEGGVGMAQWAVLAAGMLMPVLYPSLAGWWSRGERVTMDTQGFPVTEPILYGLGLPWEAMPLVAALLFYPCFMATTALLKQMPQPSAADIAERVKRQPMDGGARWAFFTRFLPGLLLLLVSYFLLTAYRDYQDYFGQELFTQLGYGDSPAIFTRTALPVAFGVILALGLLSMIRSNGYALLACFGLMIGGLLLQVGATLGFQAGHVDGVWWMVAVSLGAYLAYVPFGSVLFDRVIAKTRFAGTAVYAIYLADATGYLGAVVIKLYADLWAGSAADRLGFFIQYTWVNAGVGLVCFVIACVYFLRQGEARPVLTETPHAAT